MKKLVLKISMPDDDAKRKALKIVAAFPGIDSISVDMKERNMTIIGTVDPTKVVSRLRKYWTTELLTVGPVKEPEVVVKPIKEELKKADDQAAAAVGGDNNDEAKKDQEQDNKSQPVADAGAGDQAAAKMNGDGVAVVADGREVKKVDPALEMVNAYRAYNNNPQMTRYYYAQSMEENPNACVIC